MNKEISDSFLGTVNGGADMKAMYEYCGNWTCKHCGKTADGLYHRCSRCITKAVCEYCRHYNPALGNCTEKM